MKKLTIEDMMRNLSALCNAAGSASIRGHAGGGQAGLAAEVWSACIQVCMRLEEMAAGQNPPPPARVSQIPPGGHRGVYSITDLIDRLGALEGSRVETNQRVTDIEKRAEALRNAVNSLDITVEIGLAIEKRLRPLVADVTREIAAVSDAVNDVGRRLDDHLNSHKRLFPAALGPNPGDIRP